MLLFFLDKSVSGIIWSYSASADWQLIMALHLESFGRYVARYKNQNLFIIFLFIIMLILPPNKIYMIPLKTYILLTLCVGVG